MRRLVASVVLLCGCSTSPDEPAPTPSASAAPAVTVAPLRWTTPAAWTEEKTAEKGEYRAKYKIPATGDAKLEAELLVTQIGFGTDRDVEQKLSAFLTEFEGYPPESVARESFAVGSFKVSTVEVAGKYKFPMGPGRKKGKDLQHHAHMIKEGWRGILAAVRTPDRGTWLFRLVGPDDAVQASRSPLRTLLEGLK